MKPSHESVTTAFLLTQDDIPHAWFNITPELPSPIDPYVSCVTGEAVTADELAPLLPGELLRQEFTEESWVDIPDEVYEAYKLWRPTPLRRAVRLERALDTPAHIYFKHEGTSPTGSHKPNTAIPQVFYAKQDGAKRVVTETGAGQWGSGVAMAACLLGLQSKIYMVNVSYHQKPYRRVFIESFGGHIVASPSPDTSIGREYLKQDPDNPGNLGIAVAEAVEDAKGRDDTKYVLGSALSYVLMHQTVIGQEAKRQMEMAGEYPDIVVGCVGGGSNWGGLALPFVSDKMSRGLGTRVIMVEPTAAPSLTQGKFDYDYAEPSKTIPMMRMHSLGVDYQPASIHAGGLRLSCVAPICSVLLEAGVVEARAVAQVPVFEAAKIFLQSEAIIPAPESAHAIRAVVDEALECKKTGEAKTILFNLSGHGLFDLGAYDKFNTGELDNA
jgi:tryptophan synthase beta chain